MHQYAEWFLSGGAGIAFINLLNSYLQQRWKKKGVTDTLQSVGKIHAIMEHILEKTTIDRFLILKLENGGGKPKVGASLYVSVIMEACTQGLNPVLDVYNRVKIDGSYINILSDVSLKNNVPYVINQMNESQLKNMYLGEGMKFAELFYLCESDTAFYYASLASIEEINGYTKPEDRTLITIGVTKIAETLKSTF